MDRTTHEDLEGPEFTDAYTDALAKIIEAKREEKPLPAIPEPEQPAKVLDLMTALNESVQQAKTSRGEDADVREMPDRKTAKKQPANATTAGLDRITRRCEQDQALVKLVGPHLVLRAFDPSPAR
jgi:DNA end-binding protein Ku